MYSYIRFDTQYAVGISYRANVAPKSNLIQLGSAHEWSGVWTGPQCRYFYYLHKQTSLKSLDVTLITPKTWNHLEILKAQP